MATSSSSNSWLRSLLRICIPYLVLKDQNRSNNGHSRRDKTSLKQALPHWQILMIAIGGVIGITIFSTHGEILRLAGPGGLIVATVFVSVTMICVMECIGELVILWPVSNAMVEYVRVFVDEDWAIVVGITYWYTFSCVFATLIIVAADFSSYTISSAVGRGLLFYLVIPLALFLINVLGVEYYGFVEGVGGIIKLLMVLVGILFMIIEAPHAGNNNLDDGVQYQANVAKSGIEAICVAIPLIAYGYIGTEIVSVTAFEALDRKSLRFPARFVSYIIAGIYFLSAILQSILVNFQDPDLQNIDPVTPNTHSRLNKRADDSAPPFYAVIVIAARHYASSKLGWYFNACIIYFCISAANTALYVASRTLFGLTRGLTRRRPLPIYLKPFQYFGMTTANRQVPLFALIFSSLAFYWLIPLQLERGFEISDMLAVMSTTASIGGFMVWASQCVAYIRYYTWFHKFKMLNTETETVLPPQFNRWDPRPEDYEWHKHRMLLSNLRLIPACLGLVGCLLIIFVLSTANWWNDGDVTLKRLATAYAGPVIVSGIFLLLKALNPKWWVKLPVDISELANVTDNLMRNVQLRFDSQTTGNVTEEDGNEQVEGVVADLKEMTGRQEL